MYDHLASTAGGAQPVRTARNRASGPTAVHESRVGSKNVLREASRAVVAGSPADPSLNESAWTDRAMAVSHLLNTDFCPWANRYVYWLKHPLVAIVVGVAISGLLSVLVSAQVLPVMLVLLAAAIVGLAWPAITRAAVRITVEPTRSRVTEGDVVPVTVGVTNWLPLPVWGLSLSVRTPGGLTPDRSSAEVSPLVSLAYLGPWRTRTLRWSYVPTVRGMLDHTSGLSVTTAFPFGLWTARWPAQVVGRLIVWPRPVDVTAVPSLDATRSDGDAVSDRLAGIQGDVLGCRDYRAGDSLRQVHWAASARTGRIVCRERQAPSGRQVTVRLDATPGHHRGVGADGSLEWAIRIAAGLIRRLSGEGLDVTVELVVGSHRTTVRVGAGCAGWPRLMEALVRLPRGGDVGDASVGNNFREADSQPDGQALDGPSASGSMSRGRAAPLSGGRPVVVITTDRAEAASPICPACGTSTTTPRVVLHTAGFEFSSDEGLRSFAQTIAPPKPASLRGRARVVDLLTASDIAESFAAQWRGACHAA